MTGPTHTSEPIRRESPGTAPPHDSHPPPLPTQLRDPQRYHFLGEHGRGGLGRVSRAHDRELGRDVAIKELLARGNANEMRFLREVLITARLEHPGIVPVHEAGRWADGTPFYAMKLVAGRPLRDLIAERTTVEARIGLLHHVIAVADAIAYAHGRNIIHRDLKPSNVIVGDFGETIVIDWGLAKDLTSAEASDAGDGPLRANPDDELTSTGSVLGTRSYMAPEQERGEPVDQRADVFAIGIMLWELCSLHKVPPVKIRDRHRMLGRAGIDDDLATILDKALEPDPGRRYPHAGALAADLKAFKSGARIAARSYSLFAMLAHWTRRHRALVGSVTAAAVLAAAASVVSVRNIAIERSRTAASERAARASLDELTLKHAELLLTTDPSAAVDALASYSGADSGRADRIRAEATGRGVALLRAAPHTDNIRWTDGVAGEIFSLGSDGTISRTSLDGTTTVISRDVSKAAMWSYSPARRLLAYTCNPSAVCLLDVARATPIPATALLGDVNPIALSLSPDGSLLAVISREFRLSVLDVTDPARPVLRLARPAAGAGDVDFAGDEVVVGSSDHVEFIGMNGDAEQYPVPELSRWAARTSERELALGTSNGHALVVESSPLRVIARAELCHGPIAELQFIPGQHSVAYACREGTIGIWDLRGGAVQPRAQLDGHADLITTSSTGDYIIAAGGNGTVTVLDLATDLVASYKGHGFRLTAITPPTPDHPFVISGDARGGIRTWPLPARLARVAATSTSPFHMAVFDAQSTAVVATTWRPALTLVSPSTGVQTLEPHTADDIFLEPSGTGASFAAYGFKEGLVEVWSSTTMTRTRVLATDHSSVSRLRFAGDTDDLITSGRDGRLVRWSAAGRGTVLARLDQAIDQFAGDLATGAFVFRTVDGALWRTNPGGPVIPLGTGGSRAAQIVELPGSHAVYVGHASGDVVAIDTRTWQQETVLRGKAAVADIAVTADGRTLAVATSDGALHIGTRREDAAAPGARTWVTLALPASRLALAPDGLVVAARSDGTLWLYSPSRRRWLCLPTGTADLGRIAVATDGRTAVVPDFVGRLLWVDLDAARKQL